VVSQPPAAAPAGPASKEEPIQPEVAAALTAAATTFLNRNARIVSANPVPEHDHVEPWTQQGRALMLNSHNFRPKR
jgi:hypothetical protein